MALTYPSNMTDPMNMIGFVNENSQGSLGIIILFVIAVLSFLIAKTNTSADRAMGYAGFLLFITSIFLRFAQLITDKIFIICLILFVASVVFLFYARGKEEY